jgi:putative endonuclease
MGARVYILFSQSADKFYVGSTKLSIEERLKIHLEGLLPGAFTAKAKDWKPYLVLECQTIEQARWIEMRIKKQKSRRYMQNLAQYPEMQQKLLAQSGSS